jgi:ABC-type multidrug transport system ATPase subunit
VSDVVRTWGVTKRFGSFTAVDAVDLEVREGDRYGLLGPNGSGKTTLVRMLLGLVFPTGGRIELLGRPVPRRVAEVLPSVGALVEGPAGYPHLSGRANLRLIDATGPGGGRRSRRRRVEEALERVGLAGIDRRPLKAYSLGMRQRLGLAAALLRAPRLLILDEPTNGLDPRGIREIRELLAELNAAGTTVFLSSHLLFEVEQLCGRVGLVDRGRLVVQDDLAALRAPTGRVVLDSPDAGRAATLLDGRVDERDGDRLVVRHADPAALTAELVAGDVRVAAIAPERRSLEEVVMDLTTSGADRVDRPATAAPSAAPERPADPARRGPA